MPKRKTGQRRLHLKEIPFPLYFQVIMSMIFLLEPSLKNFKELVLLFFFFFLFSPARQRI